MYPCFVQALGQAPAETVIENEWMDGWMDGNVYMRESENKLYVASVAKK